MSMHPDLAYQLARSRQQEIRHQASLRRDRPSRRIYRRSPPWSLRRLRSWRVEARAVRSTPAR